MMKIHFDPARETAFRADYAMNSLTSVRFGLVLGAVLYALFATVDFWMLPESWRTAHLIRFGIVVPVCLTVLALTFVTRVRKHLQILVSVFVVFAGLGIVSMISLSQEVEPGFNYYYAGLMIVLTYSFTIARLRFLPTAACCIIIIVAYEFVAVLDQRLLSEGFLSGWGPVFINNSSFLVAAGVITLFGAYILEDYSRKDFRQRNELANALDELKTTQAQLIQVERTTAMSNVVAGLLHELNNPVGAIASAADIVNRGSKQLSSLDRDSDRRALQAQSHKHDKIISLIGDSAIVLRNATQRVKQTLDVLKRFSNVDKAETADFNVNEALVDCLTLLAHETGERIVVEKHFGEIPIIQCRPSEINQLFMSVLKNSVQAIPKTGRIELQTSVRDGSIRIDIIDTGIGIAEDRLKDLFVPRFSRDNSRVKLGLGLITSHSIVHRHGGSISIESTEGKGTHVSVTLPEKAIGNVQPT